MFIAEQHKILYILLKIQLQLNVLFIFIKVYFFIMYDSNIFILTWKRHAVFWGSDIKKKGKILLLYDKFLCIYLSTVTPRELGQKRDVTLMLKLKKFISNNVRNICWICVTVDVVLTDKNINWLSK
jgi:hypothetical protein